MSSKSKFLIKEVKTDMHNFTLGVFSANFEALSCAIFRLFPESTIYFHY